jgi:hypothetical protein
MQENLDGLDNVNLINERIDQDKAKGGILAALNQRAAEQDPAALMALIEIYENPSNIDSILKKLFTPEQPAASPEEMAMMQGVMGPGGPGGPGMPALGAGAPEQAPEPVQSVLSRVMGAGETGGAQTVATR